jgi:hypothetical protein
MVGPAAVGEGTRDVDDSVATERSPPPVRETRATVPTVSMSMTTHAVATLTVLMRMTIPRSR